MNKKLLILALAAIFTLISTGLTFADGPDGNKRKGKYTYRNIYKACQERGAVDSATPFLSPADKTQAQWKRIFEKKEFDVFKCDQEFNTLAEEDLLDVYTYLYNYAADSPSPAKCK